MADYERFEDGIDEWREEMAESDNWREQRKANYVPPELRHEKALQFIDRERHPGGAYDKLLMQARWRIENDEIFVLDYEIQNIKYGMVRRGECDASEAKKMFKYALSSGATVVREILIDVPELEGHVRLRKCSVSDKYPQFKHLEHALVIDQESGGDFAA